MLLQHPVLHLLTLIALLLPELIPRSCPRLMEWVIWFYLRLIILVFHALSFDFVSRSVTLCSLFPCSRLCSRGQIDVNHI
ncbi:hypothetical protein M758_8G051300 [Ceratodon purpureus]|nr:hypothetical protein M758_8G051300 [Ceratodon purpureus]